MEMWDGGLPMYSKGESGEKALKAVVGSKIMVTNPDRSSVERNVRNGDIGKIVHIHTDKAGLTRYLTYNPKWICIDDWPRRGLEYGGKSIVLWEEEFKVI